jgi:hypothetical protein
MGQELSSPLEGERVSILEPLGVSVAESPVSCAQRRAQLEEEQMERVIDPALVESIIALTEPSMPSNEMRSTEEEEMAILRREAEQDFKQWRAERKRMRFLRQHDSSTSTASSGISPLGLPRREPC